MKLEHPEFPATDPTRLLAEVQQAAGLADHGPLPANATPYDRMLATEGGLVLWDASPTAGGRVRLTIGQILFVDHTAVRQAAAAAQSGQQALQSDLAAAAAAISDAPPGRAVARLRDALATTATEQAEAELAEAALVGGWKAALGEGDLTAASQREAELVGLRLKMSVLRERAERLRATLAAAEEELSALGVAATEDAVRAAAERVAGDLEKAYAPVVKAWTKQLVPLAEALGRWQAVAAARRQAELRAQREAVADPEAAYRRRQAADAGVS